MRKPNKAKSETTKPNPIEHALAKTATVNFRLSKADKASMQATAKQLRLSLSEYLVSLHGYAKDKLKVGKKRDSKSQETSHES